MYGNKGNYIDRQDIRAEAEGRGQTVGILWAMVYGSFILAVALMIIGARSLWGG